MIECTARWVDPETFRLLPLWYPEYARQALFYKANWSARQTNTNRQTGQSEHKREGNRYANQALTYALGYRSKERPNWSCCHIWSVEDPSFQEASAVVQDPRFYSCVANMVLLPTPLKAFTDAIPKVKAMLRVCARNLYGWPSEEKGIVSMAGAIASIETWDDWSVFPASWPRTFGGSMPLGVMALNDLIRRSASNRLESIRRDMQDAGKYYPRDAVAAALGYWGIELEPRPTTTVRPRATLHKQQAPIGLEV